MIADAATPAASGSHEPLASLRARRARELADIHDAVCRWKRQGLVCSTCDDLRERADRLDARAKASV